MWTRTQDVDFANNGLSLIHGNGYPPITAAVTAALPGGTAWPGTSLPQVTFAEVLESRIPPAEQVRFVNTGTEATMLAVKMARHLTGRDLILKAWDAYHGAYSDLEAGLDGKGEVAGRTLLADFGDVSSFEKVLAERGEEIAAVILEPVLYTGRVVPPPDGFLNAVEQLARGAGAMVIIDDCLMFRLAEGGPAEVRSRTRHRLPWEVDRGGFPVGAIAASAEHMSMFDQRRADAVYHGGSFNGNPIGCVAGQIAVEDLSAEKIAEMDRQAVAFADRLRSAANDVGVPLLVTGTGSALGVYVLDPTDRNPSTPLTSYLHLAALNNGVYFGPGGEVAMATSMTDELLDEALQGLDAALASLEPLISDWEST